jgi:hypothetical protein
MLEPENNEALKIETARRRAGLIRQYQSMGQVEIIPYRLSELVVLLNRF